MSRACPNRRARPGPLLAVLLALLPLVLAGCDPDAADKIAIRETYDMIEAAEDAGDAPTYIGLLTQRSIAEYDRILKVANTAGAGEVRALPAADRVMLASLRHRIPLDQRQKLDGRALLTRILRERWFSSDPDETSKLRLGEIKVSGEYARARVIYEGKATAFWFEFVREDDRGQPDPAAIWRLDDPSRNPHFNDMVSRVASDAGVDENELIVLVTAQRTGLPVRRDIWDRP